MRLLVAPQPDICHLFVQNRQGVKKTRAAHSTPQPSNGTTLLRLISIHVSY